MKILVVSDSHSYKSAMLEAAEKEAPGMIIHLGDHDKDCAALEQAYPEIPLRSVRGNCDRSSFGKDTDEFTVAGKRFFITHGNLYGVKTSLKAVIKAAYDRGVDVLLFGHTHIPYCAEQSNMTIINPGSIGATEKTYAVLEIRSGVVSCDIKFI